jgi:hypothetical protein
VAEQLVEDLQKVRLDTEHGPKEVVGEYVEPVQLQVACRSLWDALPEGATTITEAHRAAFGNVDEVLGDFYDEAIAAAATAAGMREHSLRERFAHDFITPMGTRGTVFWTREQTGGIPATAIEELDGRHLVRAELRAGARWYELTHDRLIEPIRTSNRDFAARRSARRRRRVLVAALVVAATAAAVAVAAVAISAPSSSDARTPPQYRPTRVAVSALVERQVEIQQRITTHALVADVPGAIGEVTSVAYSGGRVEGVLAAGVVAWTPAGIDFGRRFGATQTAAVAVRGGQRARVDVSGGENDRRWRLALTRGGVTRTFSVRDLNGAASVAVSRTGRFAAFAARDGSIHVYDLVASRPGPTYKPPAAVRYVTPGFDFDERHVLFGATNGRIVRGSTMRQEETSARVRLERLAGIAVAPLGDQIAAWGSGANIVLLDGRYKTVGALPGGEILSAGFDPTGARLATSGGGRLRIWRTLPDLVVERAGIERNGALVKVNARVANLGPVRSTATSIEIPGDTKRVGALEPGKSVPVRLSARAPAGAAVPLRVARSSREQSFANNAVKLRTDADVRAQIVKAALAGAKQSSKLEYASTARIDKVRLPHVPRSANSASFATWCYWQAGAPDPNGNDYRDAGSDWLLQNGRRVRAAQPGDLVIYSIEPDGLLTAVAVGGGRVVTFVDGVARVVPLTHNTSGHQIRTYPLQATKATATS